MEKYEITGFPATYYITKETHTPTTQETHVRTDGWKAWTVFTSIRTTINLLSFCESCAAINRNVNKNPVCEQVYVMIIEMENVFVT